MAAKGKKDSSPAVGVSNLNLQWQQDTLRKVLRFVYY
jgi:hypothetical protein